MLPAHTFIFQILIPSIPNQNLLGNEVMCRYQFNSIFLSSSYHLLPRNIRFTSDFRWHRVDYVVVDVLPQTRAVKNDPAIELIQDFPGLVETLPCLSELRKYDKPPAVQYTHTTLRAPSM